MRNLIRELRGDRTQVEFAKLVGMSQAAISTYEKERIPRIEIVEKIAKALGLKMVISFEKIEEKKEEEAPEAEKHHHRKRMHYNFREQRLSNINRNSPKAIC